MVNYEESGNFFLVIVNIAKPFFFFFPDRMCILIAHRFFISMLRYFSMLSGGLCEAVLGLDAKRCFICAHARESLP